MSPGNQNRNPAEPRPGRRNGHQDRTSMVVAVGLAALAVGGVLTVFSAPLLALVAPPASDESATQAAARSAASDGGASTGATTSSTTPSTTSPSPHPDRDGHS